MLLPENAPKWLTADMLRGVYLDNATALGREVRSGMRRLSPAAIAELRASFPRESGLAAENRAQRLAQLDQADDELDRARNEIEITRAALRADAEKET